VQDDAKSQHAAMPVQAPPPRTDTNDTARKDLKKGVKAVTFLGRLMGGKKKSTEQAIADEEEIENNEPRPEGTNAHVFTQPLDNVEYNPRHPQPPAYIKVRSKFKTRRDFDRLFLAQELHCGTRRKLVRTDSNKLRRKSSAATDQDTVWAMEFSKDGKYLAAAGADMVVRVWQVLSSAEDRRRNESATSDTNSIDGYSGERLSAPVFASQPVREWSGHGSTILDLSWSKNNFLLSSSMDKTVRLWHISRKECLCTFKHNDFVPSIAFHPKDDRFFLAGSLDSKLRLWSIPDKSVAFTAQTPEMITAVAFTPDGRYAMAGCLDGQCLFYETEGLKYQTQLHVRSAKGPNARGSKITGIQAYHGSSGDIKLLITSNDSRVRLYNFRDKSLELKFRGVQNSSSQIRATLSDDGRYVICGSEDRKAHIWSLNGIQNEARDKQPVEIFEAHDSPTTVACFAPAKTRHHLGRSEDPVYDLCNPPPVTLMSQRERTESHASSRPATENGSFIRTSFEGRGSLDRPRESSIHAARAMHKSGNIIVTADYTGAIKVFRQDCAYARRIGIDHRFSARDPELRVALVRLRVFQSPRKPASVACAMAGPQQPHKSSLPTAYYPGAKASRARPTSTASTPPPKAKPPAAAYRPTSLSSKTPRNEHQPQKQTRPAQPPQPQHPSKSPTRKTTPKTQKPQKPPPSPKKTSPTAA
jgi:WD40 repeat protein